MMTEALSTKTFAQGTPEGVEDSGWLTRVAAFPIGIQPDKFVEALESPEVKGSISGLLARYAGRKVRHPVTRRLLEVQICLLPGQDEAAH